MQLLYHLDKRYGNSSLWQFIKFNFVSTCISALQILLANILPLFFDRLAAPLPAFLRPVFNPDVIFGGESRYVVGGAVTWGYVLPFFLSNFIANVFGYFFNMKTTFRGKGTRAGLFFYLAVLTFLILFSTWLQGIITAKLNETSLAALSRTIASMAAGTLQVAVLFPLEKFVLFKAR